MKYGKWNAFFRVSKQMAERKNVKQNTLNTKNGENRDQQRIFQRRKCTGMIKKLGGEHKKDDTLYKNKIK